MIVAFFDLLEAEGRLFERRIVRLWYRLILIAVLPVLVIIAVVFWVWAVYEYVALQINTPVGAMAAGFIALAMAGIVVWIVHLLRR